MVMVADAVPVLKGLFRGVPLRPAARTMVTRVVTAFLLHAGPMAACRAAAGIRGDSVHRAQVGRFLARGDWKQAGLLEAARRRLLGTEPKTGGPYLFLIDATLVGQAGLKAENTYSTGNRKRRPKKGRRHGKYRHARRSCHSFTFGLLITPSGLRIPYCRPYYSREFCAARGLPHRTTAQAAAELIDGLDVPPEARVIVLADTAYESRDVRCACARRGFSWITPCNQERVLEGPKPRPKVRSLLEHLTAASLRTVRLRPGSGDFVACRRLSPHRVGPKAKPRVYYARKEIHDVRSVGRVAVVFSATETLTSAATPETVKVLLCSDRSLSVRRIVELYALRWQIELFFKELKSHLGFGRYRFREFARVEGWCELCLLSFVALELYRAARLRRPKLTEQDRAAWQTLRTHGLRTAVREATETTELKWIAERLKTRGGLRRLRRTITASYAAAVHHTT